jgi:hypothetical protein
METMPKAAALRELQLVMETPGCEQSGMSDASPDPVVPLPSS